MCSYVPDPHSDVRGASDVVAWGQALAPSLNHHCVEHVSPPLCYRDNGVLRHVY